MHPWAAQTLHEREREREREGERESVCVCLCVWCVCVCVCVCACAWCVCVWLSVRVCVLTFRGVTRQGAGHDALLRHAPLGCQSLRRRPLQRYTAHRRAHLRHAQLGCWEVDACRRRITVCTHVHHRLAVLVLATGVSRTCGTPTPLGPP